MLVSSATASRWKKGGADAAARQAAESFRIERAQPTQLPRAASSDYRFEERGGLRKGDGDTVQDQLNQL